jgi:hypothetical protein
VNQYALQFGAARIELDAATGVVARLRHRDRDFVRAADAGGLMQFAVPLPDYPGHTVRIDQHGKPEVEIDGDTLTLSYYSLSTDHADLDVRTKITLRSTDDSLVLRAQVENDSAHTLPQLVFPQLLGLSGLDDPRRTRVQLARRKILPFVELAMRVDDLWWVDHKSQCYLPYGHREFAMKWLDFGDHHSGFTLYGTDTRYTTQGLVLDKPSPTEDSLDLRWVHYPFIGPGERWDSGDYVLLGHDGDWYAGARAFAGFARPTYPYRAPQRIKQALAIRSVWPAVRSSPPTFSFADLDRFADEVADPSYDIVELVLWHWWLHNGLPMIIDERLGSRDDLERALARCAARGVKVCMFVSHNIVRDTDETPDEWRHLNAAGQPVQDNWTYGYDLLPRFRAHFIATHAMQIAAPLSASWRQTALREYEKIVRMGGSSIMFDVFSGPSDPEFNPAADGRPDESGVRLIELAEAARKLIHDHDPDGAFAGEFAADTKVPYLDYTWEWINAYAVEDSAPFRYVFPDVRLNANVGHPRAAVIAFAEGALLNLMPGGMRTEMLADHAELARTVRRLAVLRRRFLRYFVDGEYRHREGLDSDHADARLYSRGEDALLILFNPSDQPVRVRSRVDPSAWGGGTGSRRAELTGLDNSTSTLGAVGVGDELVTDLEPDSLAVIELRAAGDREA